MAGWAKAVWSTKFARHFYTWPALGIELQTWSWVQCPIHLATCSQLTRVEWRYLQSWSQSICVSRNSLPWVGVSLCRLMTTGLSKDIRCHVWPYFFYTCKSPVQTSGHALSWLSAWWLHMVNLIFLRGLCGYVWVNILTLLPQLPRENLVIEINTLNCNTSDEYCSYGLHSVVKVSWIGEITSAILDEMGFRECGEEVSIVAMV